MDGPIGQVRAAGRLPPRGFPGLPHAPGSRTFAHPCIRSRVGRRPGNFFNYPLGLTPDIG